MGAVVLVDMDNVLADLDGAFRKRWVERYPARAAVVDGGRRYHRIVEDVPVDMRADAEAILAEDGFTVSLPVIEGAREALTEMSEDGLLVYVCTSPLSVSSANAAEKLAWVAANLGSPWLARTVITKDKTVVRGDVLIDDAVSVTGAMAPTWRHVVFDRPFNRGVEVPARMGWSTWRDGIADSADVTAGEGSR